MTPEEEFDAFATRVDRKQAGVGIVLMIVGALLGLSDAQPPADGRTLWALVLVIAGGVLADRALTRIRRRTKP